jgi:dipeptidyl aminopeptidase/acylaminoacyl peptidase
VAFSGYDWTAQTYRVSDLYVVNLDGGEMRNISSELDRDVRGLVWSQTSETVYFMADDRGSRNVHSASLNGGLKQLTDGQHMVTLSSVSDNGIAVGIRTSFHEPPDVVRFDISGSSQMTRLTRVNDDVLAGIELGEVEEIWYDSSEGERVQGWIVKPPGHDPSKRYPMILHIHGGPHGMYNVGFNNSFQNYAANDYVVLYTNPRGSTGYGTNFGNAIDNGYPSVDHDDLMAGVDAVLARGTIDASRLYVTGCSGGGVLSSWAIGQTDRFAAAAVRCPVVNWMSFAGTADITLWGYYRFDGYPWDNAEKYLEHSPLMYVGNVTTPTLLMTGELDLRTPMSQTEEYYQALRVLGVPTALLRFHKEFHGTSSMPSNFIRTQLYILDWFGKYKKGGAAPTEP